MSYSINCVYNQAGVTQVSNPPVQVQYSRVSGRRRYGVAWYERNPDNGRAHHHSTWWIDTYPPGNEVPPDYPRPVDEQPAKYPTYRLGYGVARVPDWMPVATDYIVDADPPPLDAPHVPNPGTEQWPETGPNPDTVPFPGLEPYQPPVPVIRPDPEGNPELNPEAPQVPDNVTVIRGNYQVKQYPRPQQRLAHKPPRGTKERKVRLRGVAAALWRSFGAPTELADFIDVLYECLPKAVKVRAYQRNGKQPGRAERMQIIYQQINGLDIACAIQGFIENQIEDEILGRIGRLEAGANQRNPFGRPLGYGAGFAL